MPKVRFIMEAVRDMAKATDSADLVEIATKAFTPRKSGKLDMQRVRELRNYKVSHPKGKKACEVISECERAIGTRQYIRVAKRNAADTKPENIVLDIAALQGDIAQA